MLEQRPFEVWGGAQLRDLTYVDDVTEAFLRRRRRRPPATARSTTSAARRRRACTRSRTAGRRISGDGADYTTREFPADRALIDIGSYHADDRLFRADTGWAPQVGLEDGIRRSLDWFRARLAAYL